MKPVTDPALLSQLNSEGGQMRAVQEPSTLAQLEFGLDLSQPDETIRQRISSLPEDRQQAAQRIWADYRVQKSNPLGLGGETQRASFAEGIPVIGSLLDEGFAGVDAGLNAISGGALGYPYSEGLELRRATRRASDAKYPASNFAIRMAGGLATGGGLAAGLAPKATMAGRVSQGAKIGAGYGAAEGFAYGEGGVANRTQSALAGATLGAGFGGALPVAASGATRAIGAANGLVGPTITRMRQGVDAAADDILARRMYDSGMTPAATRLDLQRGQATARLNSNSRAQLPETIADTSDSMQRLTGSLYRTGGEAGDFIRSRINQRQRGPDNLYGRVDPNAPPQGQRQRVMDASERALLIRTSDTARRTEREILRQQAEEGRRLYEAARNSSEDFDLQPALDGMALIAQQYPAPFQARLLRALNLFRDNSPRRMPVNNIARFDPAKKALDDMIEKAQRSGDNNLARELTTFKRSLLDRVHAVDQAGQPTINRTYQQAREAWGTAAERREAIDLGRSALRDGSEVGVENFSELTRGQQQLFRIGFLESMRNMLNRSRPGNDVTIKFDEPRVQELMNAIIPRSQGRNAVFANRPERFGDLMRREGRMVATRNATLGNSATAQRLQDDMQLAGDTLSTMWNRFRQSPGLANMALEAIGAGINRVFGYRQDVALALAQRLLETDPTIRNQILRRLANRGGPDRFARFVDHLDRSTNALIATQAGPLELEQPR